MKGGHVLESCILSVSSSRLDQDLWDSYSHVQYQGGMICGDMLISKAGKNKDAYSYAEFTETKWQNSGLHNL